MKGAVMNRRSILWLGGAIATFGARAQGTAPLVVPAGSSLSETPLNTGRNGMRLLLRSSDSGNLSTIVENETEPGTGPPLHIHEREDEWFFVISGQFVIQVGGALHHLKPGDSAFGPRGVAHTFQCMSKENGRLLTIFNPGGVEGFFAELTKMGHPTDEMLARWGLKVIGPPLQLPIG